MASEVMSMDQIQQMLGQTAMNVSAVSKQMGIVVEEIKTIKAHQNEQDVRIQDIQADMETFKAHERVSRSQAAELRSAIHTRVRSLLGVRFNEFGDVEDECIETDVKYTGKFISRCYADARRYSRLGTPYYETLTRDLPDVLDYINGWVPIQGVNGLKEYFNKRAAVKEEQA